jgi:hypothetical protein
MNTYLGAGADFDEDDVDAAVAARARWLFLEGYLYDKPEGKAAFTAAARHCREGGGKVGITLSDPFCVDRHRDDFLNGSSRRRWITPSAITRSGCRSTGPTISTMRSRARRRSASLSSAPIPAIR